MRPKHIIMAAVAAAFALGITGQAGAQQTTLNVATAGSQNMVDYITDYLGPLFEKANPGVKVRAVGTGPGDAGSQKIFEKLSAQQKAGNESWDTDVAVVHQKMAGTLPTRFSPMLVSTTAPRRPISPPITTTIFTARTARPDLYLPAALKKLLCRPHIFT